MAFTPETLGVIVQPIGGQGIRMVSYRSDDDLAVITATDYFVRATQYGLRVGDLVFVSPDAGVVATYIAVINAIDTGGNGTAEVSSGGAVDSVNGQTGEVVLDASDVGAATSAQGALADSALQSADVATFGQYNSATASKTLQTGSVWADLAVLTDGGTIAVDFNDGYDFGGASNANLALDGDRTLGAPTNARNGKKGVLWFGASGSTRTLTLNAAWNLMTGVETGPYSITTSQTLGVAYVTRGTTVYVTAILRFG
jgi:hypothetical protein